MFDITAFYIIVAAIGLLQIHVYWIALAFATGSWLKWVGLENVRLYKKIEKDIYYGSGRFFLSLIASGAYNLFLMIAARSMYESGRDDWADIFYMGTVKISEFIVDFFGGWVIFTALFIGFSFFVRANSKKFLKLSEKWREL